MKSKTKDQLVRAFFELLKQYPLDKITVEMILKQSNLSRRTFYSEYQNKYHLMAACYVYYVGELTKDEVAKADLYGGMEKTLQFMSDNKQIFVNLFSGRAREHFNKYLLSAYIHKTSEIYKEKKEVAQLSLHEAYSLELYNLGVVNCIELWVLRGMKLTPKEMTDVILDSMPEMLKKVMQAHFEY